MNMEKALLPKLWKVLKTGGGGSAETTYPHLLPLLSKLNKDILEEKTIQFYTNFFENINIGLTSRGVHPTSSRADVTAIATAYYECLQFVIIQLRCSDDMFENPSDLTDYCNQLVKNHVIGVIGFLLENSAAHNGKFIIARIILLVQFWAHNITDNELYAALVHTFWSDLHIVVEKAYAAGEEGVASRLDLTFELVQLLRSPQHLHKSKGAKVKFSIDEPSDKVEDCAPPIEAEPNTNLETAVLTDFVLKLCKLYVKKISDTINCVFIDHLENLLKIFGNGEFFGQLSVEAGNISKLYDKFSAWLLIGQLRQENVVDLIVMLFPHLSPSERVTLLSKLVKFPNAVVQNWILSRILSHPLCIEPDVVQLISQQSVTDLLLKGARAVIDGKSSDNINLLHKCFFQNESGDILIDCQTCEKIVHILTGPLTEYDVTEDVLDTCASFISQIMPVICSDANKKNIQNHMFLTLFQLSCNKIVSIING